MNKDSISALNVVQRWQCISHACKFDESGEICISYCIMHFR